MSKTQPIVQEETAPGAPNGRVAATPPSSQPTKTTRRRLPVVPLLILAAMLVGAAVFGYGYVQDQETYVSTDNASIAGSLLQVGSLNSGQVASVGVDIGDTVKRDQPVVTITLPSAISSSNGTTKLGFRGTGDLQVQVTSPIDGVVVARASNPGDTVAVGQSLLTVVDPTRFWVQANVEETKIGRVRVGQAVDVKIDSLGQTLTGKVAAIGRASAATFSLMPTSNTSGNFTKVIQLIPIKISLDYGQLPLTLGSSVEIKIRVAE